MKNFLTAQEITAEMEKRKTIRRERLEKKIIKITEKCDVGDVLYVFSLLINRISKKI